jgi:hypothetical protein
LVAHIVASIERLTRLEGLSWKLPIFVFQSGQQFERKEFRVGERVRNESALVYANVGVHDDVEIALALYSDGGQGAAIHFGLNGPDLILDFADLDSLERLATVAADGARQLRERAGEEAT